MNRTFARLRQILLEDPTANVRFFFGLVTIGYALFIPHTVSHAMYDMANSLLHPLVWCAIFLINGICLVWGSVHNKPGPAMFVLEGLLGAVAWLVLGVATAISQGMPGPTFFASFIAVWVFVRYPTWRV